MHVGCDCARCVQIKAQDGSRGVARGEHVWAGGEAESEGHGIRHWDGGGKDEAQDRAMSDTETRG